jgi:hypothetical protein
MATKQNGNVDKNGLIFHFDISDTYNSYFGRPTTNMLGDTMSNYNNVGGSVTTTLTTTGEYYRGAPIYKQVLTPLDASGVSWLSAGNNPGLGVVTGGGGGTGGRYTGHSIFFKPTVPMNGSPIFTHYSNIGGWQSSANYEDMGDGWFRAHVIWYDTVTRSDGKYWAINPLIASLNVPITIYWAGPFKEDLNVQNVSQYIYSSRSVTNSLKDLTGTYTMDLTNVSFSNDVRPQITFDGSNDYIDIQSQSLINGTADFTIEAVYNKTGSNGGAIFCNYGPSYGTGVWFSGMYGIYIQGAVYAPGYPLANGKYHMVATRQSGYVRLYLNGVLVNSATLSSSIPTNVNYRIGADVNGAGEPFTGDIYSLKVYNRALRDYEVFQNYSHYKTRHGLPSPSMTYAYDGSTSERAVSSAKHLKNLGYSTNGVYWLKPTSDATPFQAYVEFDSQGGDPWVHVGTISDENEVSNNSSYHVWSNNLNNPQTCSPWDDATTIGGSDPLLYRDYKNLGWSTIPFSQIMVKDDGTNQRKLFYTNKGQIKSNNSSLTNWFKSLKWGGLGSDMSNDAYRGNRVKTLDITNYGVVDPVLQSGNKSKMLFKFGEVDGAQDGNKDRTMIAWHPHDTNQPVDCPTGLGCFTNRSGTIDYRDIVPGEIFPANQDYPPSDIGGGSYSYTIWIR